MVSHFFIRKEREYGEFFVHERQPEVTNDRSQYSATWCCYSSFGVFGHHWSHMGVPFTQFISDLDEAYLVKKISKPVFSEQLAIAGVRKEITDARREKRITKEQARDAFEAVRQIEENYSGESVATLLYEDADIAHVKIDFCEISTQVPDPEAVNFARLLWPEFVAAVFRSRQPSPSTVNDYLKP